MYYLPCVTLCMKMLCLPAVCAVQLGSLSRQPLNSLLEQSLDQIKLNVLHYKKKKKN